MLRYIGRLCQHPLCAGAGERRYLRVNAFRLAVALRHMARVRLLVGGAVRWRWRLVEKVEDQDRRQRPPQRIVDDSPAYRYL
ncbi:MAG: hypothetical protein LC130_33385 [Bryobacterales bacterium]|nr:hypothetical protein [Bryobacterales bacterium]